MTLRILFRPSAVLLGSLAFGVAFAHPPVQDLGGGQLGGGDDNPGVSLGDRQPVFEVPNILIITLDDVPTYAYNLFDDVAPYELDGTFTPNNIALDANGTNLYARTPNLQRLADAGVTFLNAYANPVCSTSRASLLTGMFPHGHGVGAVIHTDIDPTVAGRIHEFGDSPFDVKTLAELVVPRGYRSGHFGKWHLAGWDGSDGTELDFPGTGWAHIPTAGHWDEYKSTFHNPPVPPMPYIEALQRLTGSQYHWIRNSNGEINEYADAGQDCGDLSITDYTAEVQFNDAKEFCVTTPEPWLCALMPNVDHALFQDPPDSGVATDEYHLVDEVQTFDLDTTTGGTFSIKFGTETTAAIAYDASASDVEDALELLSNIDPGDVTVTGGDLPAELTATFAGTYADTDVARMELIDIDLVGAPDRLPVLTPVPGDCGPTAWHAFQAALEYMDLKLGELLDALEASGRLDDTLVIFTSDNGGPRLILDDARDVKATTPGTSLGATVDALLNEDAGNRFKQTIYEGGVRVPLVISGRGVALPLRGTTTKALFHLADIYPTIAKTISEPRGNVQGVDQTPVLKGQTDEVRKEVLAHMFAPNGDYTVISGDRVNARNYSDFGYSKRLSSCDSAPAGRYRIVRFYNADGSGFDDELYQLEDENGDPVDPYELNDLIDDATYDCQETRLLNGLASLLAP